MKLLLCIITFFVCNLVLASTENNDEKHLKVAFCDSPVLSPWQCPQKTLRTAEDPVVRHIFDTQFIVCARAPYLSVDMVLNCTVSDEREIALEFSLAKIKCKAAVLWKNAAAAFEYEKRALELLTINQNASGGFAPAKYALALAAYGEGIAHEFWSAKHAFVFGTHTENTLIAINEDEPGENGEERLWLSANGDLSQIHSIFLLLFAMLPNSEFVYTGNPAAQLTKTMQALGFKPQKQYGVNTENGEMIHIRPSNNVLEKQEIISFVDSKGNLVRGTIDQLSQRHPILKLPIDASRAPGHHENAAQPDYSFDPFHWHF